MTNSDVPPIPPLIPPILAAAISSIIVVVEDDDILRMVTSTALRADGFNVLEAANAEEALAHLNAGEVALVFSDVRMPGTMDGVALALHMREAFPHIKVIITSGHLAASEAFGLQLIGKPYSMAHVVASFRELLAPVT